MKTKLKKFRTKKLFLGYASVRDYIIQECQEERKDLLIKYKDQEMLVLHTELSYYTSQFYKDTIFSKTGGKNYKLIDIRFKPRG